MVRRTKKVLRVKRARDYACFDYPAYLDRRDKVLDKRPKGCPYDVGDVVVVEGTQAVGVVLGCICEDGELRTDADGMCCWNAPGHLRFATIEDVRTLRCSDKLQKDILGGVRGVLGLIVLEGLKS